MINQNATVYNTRDTTFIHFFVNFKSWLTISRRYSFKRDSLILGMIGYGMAKAAVHQLVHSLACEKSGLPDSAFVSAILP